MAAALLVDDILTTVVDLVKGDMVWYYRYKETERQNRQIDLLRAERVARLCTILDTIPTIPIVHIIVLPCRNYLSLLSYLSIPVKYVGIN